MFLDAEVGNRLPDITSDRAEALGNRFAENKVETFRRAAQKIAQRPQFIDLEQLDHRSASPRGDAARLVIDKAGHDLGGFGPELKCPSTPVMHDIVSLVEMRVVHGGQQTGLSLHLQW